MNAQALPGLRVEIISDVVCPWCFIGGKRLERAVALVPEIEVTVGWRPYQLDPAVPPDGLPRHDYMLKKFGDRQKLDEIHARLVELGEVEGIRFHFDAIRTQPNTLDAHRLIRWAGSAKAPAGAQNRVAERLFELFFEEARNIGDRAVLAEAAEESGMDAALVTALLASNADVDAVRGEIDMAAQMGVRGVPCFLIEGKYALVGAQEAETLADALRQIAGAKARGELEDRQT